MEKKREIHIWRLTDGTKEIRKDSVVTEVKVQILLNGKIVSEVSCTPNDLEYLAVGNLYAKKLITSGFNLDIEINGNEVNVSTSNESTVTVAIKNYPNEYTIPKDLIFEKTVELLTFSSLFKETGGSHTVGVFDLYKKKFLYVAEDIGRHNAVEKCMGYILLNTGEMRNPVLFASGRANSKIVENCATLGISAVITKSAVTDKAVKSAEKHGITLIGFVRGKRANIYTHPERVI